MRALLVVTPRYAGLECEQCHKLTEHGQVILVQKIKDVSYNVAEVVWHKTCIDEVMATAPEPIDKRTFDLLRARMLDTGQVFPVS